MSTATDTIIARIIDNNLKKNTPKVVRDVLTDLVAEMLPLLDENVKAKYTRGAIQNTFKTMGSRLALISQVSDLLPPDSPQPETGGNYNGFVRITGLSLDDVRGLLEPNVAGDSVKVIEGGAGDYEIAHAWVNVASSVNNTNMAFTVAILRSGFLNFASRAVGTRIPNQTTVTNMGGGGFLTDMVAGDEVQVWVAADRACTLDVRDLNVGINMQLTEYARTYAATLLPTVT